MSKFKTIISWILVVVGCLMLSTYGIVRWTEQQFLDTNNWVATMATLPKDKVVADSIGKQLVDRLFDTTDITTSIQSVLPPKLEFLAPTISGFLHTKADELATKLIMSDRFTQIWTDANRTAHQKLVASLRQPASRAGQTKLLPYKINLAKAQDWLQAASAKSDNAALLSASNTATRVESFNASLRAGLNQARAIVRAADALYGLLPYIIMASFLSAVALARRRSKVVLGIAVGIVSLSVLAIAGVNFLRPALINILQDQTYQPLFSALWSALLPPFVSFQRGLVVAGFLLITAVLLWRKQVFSKLNPSWLKRNKYYQLSAGSIVVARNYIGSIRNYIYGLSAALAALLVAFRADQTPQSILKVVFLAISFAAVTSIVATPRLGLQDN